MAEFSQAQTPFKLSEDSKKKLRGIDEVRPYLHRAAMFALPAMAGANYLTPLRHADKKHSIIAGIGAVGAGMGLLDRKIESLAEEHAELRPTLKNYAKHTGGGMVDSAKLGSVSDRVRRNQDELAAAFPMTMAQRVELQKEALMLDPRSTGRGLATAFRTMKGPAPALVGAGVGAVGGAVADGENRGRGALTGALVGGALGGAATGLTHAYKGDISAGLRKANVAAMKGGRPTGPGTTPTSAGDYYKNFKEGFKGYKPPASPDGAAVVKRVRKPKGATKVEQPPGSTAANAAPVASPTAVQTSAPSHPTDIQAILAKPGHTRDASEVFTLNRYNSANGLKLTSAPFSSLRAKLYHMTSKEAGINTMHDAHRAIGGRPPYALLTMGGETSNDAVINQMLRALFANTDAMRKATEDQVLAAFPLSAPYSYGRHRAIGRTADDIKAEIALAYTPTQR